MLLRTRHPESAFCSKDLLIYTLVVLNAGITSAAEDDDEEERSILR